jgi:hypothetical protein
MNATDILAAPWFAASFQDTHDGLSRHASGNHPATLVPNRATTSPALASGGSGQDWIAPMAGIVTDEELQRARQDPAFRHQLVADSLDLLLRELNRLRSSADDAARAQQIREGVDLAVKLADLLQRIDGAPRAA